MKYLKKKEKKRWPKVLGLIAALLAIVLVIVWFGLGDETPKEEPGSSVAEPSVDTQPTAPIEPTTEPTEVVIEKPVIRDYEVVELVDGQIQTPHCTLSYPEELADHLLVLNTCEEPYTLEFYAVMEEKQELRLFDLSFSETSGNMGNIVTSNGEVFLNITIYTLEMDETWSEGEITTAYAMQDVVNEIVEQLQPKAENEQPGNPEISQQPNEGGTMHNLEIETPHCTLYYPAQWANTVSIEHDDSQAGVYKVYIYSRMAGLENQLLFSIYFGGDEGDQLGAVMSSEGIPVPVYLLMNPLQLEGLSDQEVELLCTMQEAANELIGRLPLLQ